MDLLEERIFLIEERIVYVRELEKPSPETISQSADYIRKISNGWEKFGILVEFPARVVPDAKTRHRVIAEMSPLKDRLDHVAVVSKSNVVISLTIRFIGIFSGFNAITLHANKEEALQEILKRRAPQ